MAKQPAEPKMTRQTVELRRREYARAIREFQKTGARYFQRAPELPAEALAECQMLPNRYMLLDLLPKGGVMAEIGAETGAFSHEILTRCSPSALHLFEMDPDRISQPEVLSELEDDAGRIELHVGDSAAAMRRVPDGFFDIVYVDGDRSYEGVKRDIEATLPKLKPTGSLVFNDYSVWSPVGMFHCGVARAVHELCLEQPWKFRYLALQTMMYNDVMLVRA